jgi:hypothetical protein
MKEEIAILNLVVLIVIEIKIKFGVRFYHLKKFN